VAPAIPKLTHPTSTQRSAAKSLTAASLHRQGIRTRADIAALPAEQRQRVNRAIGYSRTSTKRSDAAAGRIAVRQMTPVQLTALGINPRTLTVRQLATLGRRMRAVRGDLVTAGRDHRRVGIGPAAIDLTSATKGLQRGIMAATSLDTGDLGPREFFGNAASDVGAIASAPYVGAYTIGAGTYDLVRHGRTKRLTDLAKGVGEGLLHSVPGELVRGHPGRAADALREHPVFAALDISGAAAIAGRTAGAVARGLGSHATEGGARGSLARAGTTVRPAVGLNEDGGLAVTQRSYSKDLTRKAIQVAADSARKPLLDAQGRQVTVTDRGRQVPVLQAHRGERQVLKNRRVDFTASRANATERLEREQAGHTVGQAGEGGRVRGRMARNAKPIVSMAVEKTIRPGHFKADVEKRIARLEDRLKDPATNYRHSGEVKQARAELDALKRARTLTEGQQQQVFAAADRVIESRKAQDLEEIRLGTLDPKAARRAELEQYAIAHMDARHHTVEEHAALERHARAVERQARSAVDDLPKGSKERAHALQAYRAARDHRIAVSGRHPGEVRRHENAHSEARRAEAAHQRAESEVRKLERARQRLSGAQQVQRGAESARRMQVASHGGRRSGNVLAFIDDAVRDPDALAKGAAKQAQRERVLATVDARLKAAREKEKATGRAAKDARERANAVARPDAQAALRTAEGKHLPNEAIEAHMREHGVDPASVAQLTHRQLGSGAYHKRFTMNRPGQSTQRARARRTTAARRGSGPSRSRTPRRTRRRGSRRRADRQVHPRQRAEAPGAVEGGARRDAHEGRAEDRGARRGVHAEGGRGARGAPGERHGPRVRGRSRCTAPGCRRTRNSRSGHPEPARVRGPDGKLLNDRVIKGENLRDRGARNVALIPLEDFNRLARHAWRRRGSSSGRCRCSTGRSGSRCWRSRAG
jgi:hypothetical protein